MIKKKCNQIQTSPELVENQFSYRSYQNKFKYYILAGMGSYFVLFGFLMDTPLTIWKNFYPIIVGSDILITDYIAIAGFGASFVNAGLLMLLSLFLLWKCKVEITGVSIASLFLMGGFALFGKNIVNVWPMVLGTFLYGKIKKRPFRDFVHVALLGTSISPMVSEFLFVIPLPWIWRIILALSLGISAGFIIPALAPYLFKVSGGFNLYNVGFSVGILGTLYVSLFKSFGYESYKKLEWSQGNNFVLTLFLVGLFSIMFSIGYLIYNPILGSVPRMKNLLPLFPKNMNYKELLQQTGRLSSDFVTEAGLGITLINMAINGLIATLYVILVKGDLNGPTIGGILAVVGFGAFGKHLKNILPIFIGVGLGSLTKTWNINDPPILLAALFGTSLAPIAGHYGWIWGIVASFLNSSVVLNSGILHGGMNLYNTGFSAGIVAAVLWPVMQTFSKKTIPEE